MDFVKSGSKMVENISSKVNTLPRKLERNNEEVMESVDKISVISTHGKDNGGS